MKIICAPQKVGVGLRHNLTTIRRLRPLIAGLTEMDLGGRSETHLIRTVFGSRYTVLVRDKGGHSEEIPLVVRTGPFTKVLHYRLLPISPDVGDKGTGNDRWLAEVWLRRGFRRFGHTYAVLHTHVDAVIQNHHTGEMFDNERTTVTAEAMAVMEQQAAAILADDSVSGLWVMGDLNILPVGPGTEFPHARPWEHSPQSMFRRLGMDWHNSRVVYIAWSKGQLEARGDVRTVPAHSKGNLADHGWLVGRFARRRGKAA